MPELWDQLQQQPVAEPPSLWPQGDRAPLRITVGGPTMKDGAQASPGSSLDPFNPPQVQYVGTPLANTLWSALKEMGVKGQRLLSGLQQYSGEQFPASAGTQTMSTDTEPVKQAVENMDSMLANLWGVGSASVPRGAVGAIGSSPFYSAAQRAVENAKLGKGTPEQWLGYLRNQPGVKAEELDRVFGNLPQQGMLTKADMQAHAAENAVTLGEVNKGAVNNVGQSLSATRNPAGYWEIRGDGNQFITNVIDGGNMSQAEAIAEAQARLARNNPTEMRQQTTKWGPDKRPDLSLPGGENYREKLLTLPTETVERAKAVGAADKLRAKYGDNFNEYMTPAERSDYIKAVSPSPQFRSSHWDEPNVLAHIRMNDREVPGVGKSLHLEEIQSDWHQKGRNEGYSLPSEQTALMDSEYRALVHKNADARARGYEPNDADVNRARELETALIRSDQSKIPDAPFKSTWPDVALKRSIRDAAEGGYDALSWTPGEAQAARYDLSKHVDNIKWEPAFGSTNQLVKINPKGGNSIEVYVNNKGVVEPNQGYDRYAREYSGKNLADIIGKEVAEKIVGSHKGELSGEGLSIGGEGMKAFYDKMLVDKANALGKKHGARVEQASVPIEPRDTVSIERAHSPVHVLRITPQLREAAMKGFPLFSALFGATAAAPSLWPQEGRQ